MREVRALNWRLIADARGGGSRRVCSCGRRERDDEDHRRLRLAVRSSPAAGSTVRPPRGHGGSPGFHRRQGHRDRRLLSRRRVPRLTTRTSRSAPPARSPQTFPACPFELFFPALARADAALADPGSQSRRLLRRARKPRHRAPRTRRSGRDTSTGTHGAFFRVDSVTVGKADCKNGWLDELTAASSRIRASASSMAT